MVESGIVRILEEKIVEIVRKLAEGIEIFGRQGIFLKAHIFGNSQNKVVGCFLLHCRAHCCVVQGKAEIVDFPDILFGQGNDGCADIGYGF